MTTLKTQLNPRSEEARANALAMRALVDDLNTRLARIAQGGGEAARQGEAPVLITSPAIRPFVRGIVERFRAQTSVMSQSEIHPRVRLKTLGSI